LLRAENADSRADTQEQKAKEYNAALIEKEKEVLKLRADLELIRGDASSYEGQVRKTAIRSSLQKTN
jgi:uncharacterized coiled-coil protein SlyX